MAAGASPRLAVLRHAVQERLHRDPAAASATVARLRFGFCTPLDRRAVAMDISNDFPGQSRARFWFVFALFVFLMVLAHGAAELKGSLDGHAAPGTEVHTVLYYRVIFSIWATIFLLTPALCFHVFSVADDPNNFWRAFWTFAYVAFLVHLYWSIVVTFQL